MKIKPEYVLIFIILFLLFVRPACACTRPTVTEGNRNFNLYDNFGWPQTIHGVCNAAKYAECLASSDVIVWGDEAKCHYDECNVNEHGGFL